MTTVPERLKQAAKTYQERNKVYGDSYKTQGDVLDALFPEGMNITHEDYNRIFMVNMIVSKLIRYCENFNDGGHQDSIHDLGVYAFMLEELDEEL